MSKPRLMAAAAASLLALTTLSSYAHSGGGGTAGASSAGHMSSKGLGNTNSTVSGDRDKGLTRAADRANTHAHSHPGVHSNKGKHVAIGHAI